MVVAAGLLFMARRSLVLLALLLGLYLGGSVYAEIHRRSDPAYAKVAEARIAAIEPLPEATLKPFMTAREAPRVAFSELI